MTTNESSQTKAGHRDLDERENADRPWIRLTRLWRNGALAAHIVLAVGLIGADASLIALTVAGLRGADPTAVYPAAETIAQTVIAPLAILALASGLIQGLVTRWGVLRHWWVAIKLSLTVALVVVVFTLLLPRLGEAANLPAQQGGSLTTQLQARLVVFPTVAVTVLLVLVALAIYKPFGRLSARKSGGES